MTKFAQTPRTAEGWANTYMVQIDDDRLAPRCMQGEMMIFSRTEPAEKGQLARLVFMVDGEESALIGTIKTLTPKTIGLVLSLDKDERPLWLRRNREAHEIHPCVGIMTPMHGANARANAAVNAAIRQRDGSAA